MVHDVCIGNDRPRLAAAIDRGPTTGRVVSVWPRQLDALRRRCCIVKAWVALGRADLASCGIAAVPLPVGYGGWVARARCIREQAEQCTCLYVQ